MAYVAVYPPYVITYLQEQVNYVLELDGFLFLLGSATAYDNTP